MQRLNYIDGIKALMIFFVVFGHVEFFGMGGGLLSRIQDLFCMPVFFFMSGVFAKPIYSCGDLIVIIKKRFFQLVIPFICCSSLYTFLLQKGDFNSLIFSEVHNGYWFLLVLFEICLLFSLVSFIVNKIHRASLLTEFGVYLCLSAVLVILQYKHCLPESTSSSMSFFRLSYNFPYYWLGHFCWKYGIITKIQSRSIYYEVSSIIFIFTAILAIQSEDFHLPLLYLCSLSAIIILFSMFKKYELQIPRVMLNVGKNTLGIYVFQYFFVPYNVHWIANGLLANNSTNISIEFFLISLISCMVLVLSYATVLVVRQSKILSFLFLGERI